MTKLRQGPQLLRHQLVHWLPTQAELSQRTSLVITDRDRQILQAVYTHGVLTTELMELAFFSSGTVDRAGHSSSAYERLRQLWLWSYLDKLELPTARAFGGRRSMLYTLGRAGVPVVEDALGADAPRIQRRRLDRLDPLFLDHDLKAAALWANLQASTRTHRLRLCRWISERELRARRMKVRDPQTNRLLPVLPDGMFTLVYGDLAPLCWFVEIDMGTLTISRFRRKVRALEAYWQQGLFEQVWGLPDFVVVILTRTQARLNRLWDAVGEELCESRRSHYMVADFDALDPRQFIDFALEGLDQKMYSLVPSRWRITAQPTASNHINNAAASKGGQV